MIDEKGEIGFDGFKHWLKWNNSIYKNKKKNKIKSFNLENLFAFPFFCKTNNKNNNDDDII